jgi:TonB family protein
MTDYSKDIERYLKGEMTPAERHALEKKSLSDPFLAEAMEGAAQITADEFAFDIQTLHQAIDEHSKKEQKKGKLLFWSLRIAAGLIILVIATYLILNLSDEIKPEQQLGNNESVQKAAPSELKTDSTNKSDKPLAMTEEIKKEEKAENALSTIERKEKTNAKKITAYDEAESPFADVLQTEKPAEESKAAPVASHVVSSVAEAEEKNTSPVAVSEAAKKEAEPTIPVTRRGASTSEKAKRSVADQGFSTSLPATSISGVVTAAEDGSPLPGVNVVLKGTTIGTITDVEGKFKLDSATLASTLVYSFIGMKTKEVNVTNNIPLNVEMSADISQLSEVVVVGYGNESRSEEIATVNLAHPEIGNRSYKKYLEENRIYPQSALDSKTEGRVTVEFFVESNGSLSDFTIIKGIGSGCDEELIRLIKEGPKWVPTKKNNQPVRDKARVRLNFQLPGK